MGYFRFTSSKDDENNEIHCHKHCKMVRMKYNDSNMTCYERPDKIIDILNSYKED